MGVEGSVMEKPGGCTFCKNAGEVLIERARWPGHMIQTTKPCPECARDASFIYKCVHIESPPGQPQQIHVDYLLKSTLESIRVELNPDGSVRMASA